MSRVERSPLKIPTGVEVTISGNLIKIKGPKGAVEWLVRDCVKITKEDGLVKFVPISKEKNVVAIAGTARALVRNMLEGVTTGYERKLQLKGVGYKAQAQGDVLNLAVGFSHPIKYKMPAGVQVATPSQTEVVVKSMDKRLVGHVAAVIRGFQPPEPYKGKGIRYAGEIINLKEGKKK